MKRRCHKGSENGPGPFWEIRRHIFRGKKTWFPLNVLEKIDDQKVELLAILIAFVLKSGTPNSTGTTSWIPNHMAPFWYSQLDTPVLNIAVTQHFGCLQNYPVDHDGPHQKKTSSSGRPYFILVHCS